MVPHGSMWFRMVLHDFMFFLNFYFTIYFSDPGRHIDDEQQTGLNNVTTNSTPEVLSKSLMKKLETAEEILERNKNVQLVGVRLPLRSRSDF